MQITIDLPPLFIKVGKKEYLENLINHGEVYFGALEDYRGKDKEDYNFKLGLSAFNLENKYPEKDFIREDPLESVQSITYPKKLDGDYQFSFHQPHTHACSLFGFSHEMPENFKVNDSMRKFGDYFAFFDSKLFLETINPILSKINLSKNLVEYGYIKYYDIEPGKNISDLTSFHKKRRYDFQYEYRILATLPAISSEKKGSIINLGTSLQTFYPNSRKSQVLPIDELFKLEINP